MCQCLPCENEVINQFDNVHWTLALNDDQVAKPVRNELFTFTFLLERILNISNQDVFFVSDRAH